VRPRSIDGNRGHKKFFEIGLGHESLSNMMLVNHSLMLQHHYSLSELESLIPWEYRIYIELVAKFVREENERIEKQNRGKN